MKLLTSLMIALLVFAAPLSAAEEEQCPIQCATNEAGEWEIEIECEKSGQRITKEHLQGFTTRFEAGLAVSRYGEVTYHYLTTGNIYTLGIEITACQAHETGYCIAVIVTGGNIGDDPATCMNF